LYKNLDELIDFCNNELETNKIFDNIYWLSFVENIISNFKYGKRDEYYTKKFKITRQNYCTLILLEQDNIQIRTYQVTKLKKGFSNRLELQKSLHFKKSKEIMEMFILLLTPYFDEIR
jgi:hypothetical protein